MEGAAGHEVRENQLDLFREALDGGSQRLLDLELEKDADLTFSDFWGLLNDLHGSDHTTSWKEDWRNIRLEVKGHKLGMMEWRKFQTAFETARLRVTHYTEDEERALVLDQVPAPLVSDIIKEEHRQMALVPLAVRIRTNAVLRQDRVVDLILGQWQLPNDEENVAWVEDQVSEDTYGWVVDCKEEHWKLRLLALDDVRFHGCTL